MRTIVPQPFRVRAQFRAVCQVRLRSHGFERATMSASATCGRAGLRADGARPADPSEEISWHYWS